MIDKHTIYLLQEDWLQQCLNYCSYVVDCIENRNWLFQGIENNLKKRIKKELGPEYKGSGQKSVLYWFDPSKGYPMDQPPQKDNLFQGETKQRILMATCKPFLMLSEYSKG